MTRDKRAQGDDPPGHTESGPPSGAIRFPTSGPTGGPSKVCPTPHPESQGQEYIAQEGHLGVGEQMDDVGTQQRTSEPDYLTEVVDRRVATFKAFMVKVGRSRNTAMTYGNYVTLSARAVGKDPALWEAADLKALLASPDWAGWSPSTRKIVKASLVAFWKVLEVPAPTCLEWTMMRKGAQGSSSRTEELRAQAPTPEEVERVRSYCRRTVLEAEDPSEVYNAFATLLVSSYGLRCVDAASVRVQDVRLAEGVIHIPKGKGSKPRTIHIDIPLGEDVWQRFMSARDEIVSHLLTTNVDFDSLAGTSPLFFTRGNHKEGKPFTGDAARSLHDFIPRVARLALGRHVNAHAFRHAKAFELMDQGIPIETVADYLGHANIQQTREYRWAEVDAQRSAFAKVNGADKSPAPAPAPAQEGKVAEAIRTLAALLQSGALTQEAFTTTVAALTGGS